MQVTFQPNARTSTVLDIQSLEAALALSSSSEFLSLTLQVSDDGLNWSNLRGIVLPTTAPRDDIDAKFIRFSTNQVEPETRTITILSPESDPLYFASGIVAASLIGDETNTYEATTGEDATQHTITNNDPTSGAVADASIADGDTDLDVDSITGQVPVGTTFTIADVTGTFTVVATTETEGNTTNIEFTPALAEGNLPVTEAVLTIAARGIDVTYQFDIETCDRPTDGLWTGDAFTGTIKVYNYTTAGWDTVRTASAATRLEFPLEAKHASPTLVRFQGTGPLATTYLRVEARPA